MTRIHVTAAAAAAVDTADRTLTGLAAPYGQVGYSSVGPIMFSRGGIRTPATLGRVKLLRQHDSSGVVLGYLTGTSETSDGLHVTMHVPSSPEGDAALAEATDGRRDGLSVGVTLDPESVAALREKWMAGDDTPTEVTGELVEVSQVAIPAFADARIDGSPAAAAAHLDSDNPVTVTFATTTTTPTTPEGPTMPTTPTAVTTAADTTIPATADAAQVVATAAAAPAPIAGAALTHVTSEVVYSFDGAGPSMVRDAWAAHTGNADALARLQKFQRLVAGVSDPAAAAQRDLMVMTAAAEFATAAVDTRALQPNALPPNGFRPDRLVAAIDRGRPLISRLNVDPLTDATPFYVPSAGLFGRKVILTDGATTNASKTVTSATGAFTSADIGIPISGTGIPGGAVVQKINSGTSVDISEAATATGAGVSITLTRVAAAANTEGTAHNTEGNLVIPGQQLVTPIAIDAAYRVSRTLAESSNPALDRMALRAMARDYGMSTEGLVATAIGAGAAVTVTGVSGTGSVMKARLALNAFEDAANMGAAFLACSPTFYAGLIADVDTTGRPQLATVNPQNAMALTAGGVSSPTGGTGVYIDGTELVKSHRFEGGAGAAVSSDDVFVGESSLSQFVFSEVEGPGVIKLALWSYFATAVLRSYGLRKLTV